MKKGYVLLVIVMVLVLIAGCTDEVKTERSKDSGPIPAAQSGDSISSSPGSSSSGGTVDGGTDTTEKGSGEAKGAEVIVKSGSDVASKDKAELLNQIDQELDQMINDINNLEDISDSDLQ